MKIILLISSIHSKSSGLGGHYHSLIETAKQLDKRHEVSIVNIGTDLAKSLEHSPVKVHSIIYRKPVVFRILKELESIVRSEKPDIVHSFDRIAHYWGRIISRRNGLATFLTKCGGPNDKYYPFADNLVLYSLENKQHFEGLRKFRHSNIYLIPNRISYFPDDEGRIGQIRKMLDEKQFASSFIFLRITRIGSYYLQSSLQLMNLVRRLRADGVNCCAVFIGTIQDLEVLDQLREGFGDLALFFTDEYYTKNAKALINIGDVVLGTGRSLMEASSKQKPLLCPALGSEYPVLLDELNFSQSFFYNFSERALLENVDSTTSYEKILKLVKDHQTLLNAQEFSGKVFEEYFDASQLADKYNIMYSAQNKNRWRSFTDFVFHTFLLAKTYLKK